MRPARIDVHVDELVLHGLPPLDPARFQAAFERELAVQLAADRLEAAEGGSVEVGARARAEDVGAAVAGRVAGALGRPAGRRSR